MTEGISGWQRPDWRDVPAPGDGPPSALAPRTPAPARDALDYALPLLPQPLPRAALAPAAGPTAPMTQAARDAQVRASLDAFRQAMSAPYRTPEGIAWPGTPFQMMTRYLTQAASVAKNAAALKLAVASAHLSGVEALELTTGRGSPEAIHAVTQALIDQGRLPPASAGTLDARVRTMMFNHGIGVDCAGYVQQAYLRVMHLDRAAAHFTRTDDDLSTLGARGYTRITDLTSVRPGDLVLLGPPPGLRGEPGHRAIVYEQHLASAEELDELRGHGRAGAKMAAAGPVRIVQVDSSWGSGGDPLAGGVRRETWWHSDASGAWGWLMPHDPEGPASLETASTPIAHPFAPPFGIFRGASRQ
jgi:hypothetical protein